MLPESLQQICHLFPLTVRIKLSIYFHTLTSKDNQFSHANVLLSKAGKFLFFESRAEVLLMQKKKKNEKKQPMLHSYKPTRQGYGKMIDHKKRNSVIAFECICMWNVVNM